MASTTAFQALALAIAILLLTTTQASRQLQGEGGGEQQQQQPECWTALSNIRTCSNEIIGFMLNGQADLDRPCCVAIVSVAEFCWPSLVAALGYSPETVTLLQDYCDSTTELAAASHVTAKGSP